VADSKVNFVHCIWLAVPGYMATNTTQYQAGRFSTLEDHPRTQPKAQTLRRVSFPHPFRGTPSVVAWIEGFEMATLQDWRMKTYATEVDASGFTIHVDTWNDTTLHVGNVSWVAYDSSASPNVVSHSLATRDVHALDSPKNWTWGDRVRTEWPQGVRTGNVPTVLAAFSAIDIDDNSLFRFSDEVEPQNITADYMEMTIGAGAQTRFRDGEVSYVAVFA
jgi:hypothetical protein